MWTLSALCAVQPGSLASSVSTPGRQGGVWRGAHQGWCCVFTLASPIGHCCQHLDGGEGVVCLTHKQVSWPEGQCSSSDILRPLCLKGIFLFSSVVRGGYLLIGLKLKVTLLPCLVSMTEAEYASACSGLGPDSLSQRWWLWCLSSGYIALAGLTSAGIMS